MSKKNTRTEAQILENYRVALENVTGQPQIAQAMEELGYDEAQITIGKEIWNKAQEAYKHNKQENDETTEAYNNFYKEKTQLTKIYALHRKKAKVIFRKQPVVLQQLQLHIPTPQAYIKWLEVIKKFYDTLAANQELQTALIKLKLTVEEITETLQKINTLEYLRAEYLREKGESQEATKAKNKALLTIEDWMLDFYGVAKIALEETPQLLEALGKKVKS